MKIQFKKKWILIVVLVLIIGLVVVNATKGPKATEVETVAVKRGGIETLVSATGVVSEDTNRSVFVETGAKVNKVLVEKNEAVKAGQQVLDFDFTALNSQLSQARINLDVTKLNRQKMNVTTGNSQDATLLQVENTLKLAKENYERNLALYEVGGVSKVELDNSKISYDNAQATYDMQTSNKGTDSEILNKQIQLLEIQIGDLERTIQKLRDAMYSPIDGVVSSISVVDGGIASPGMALYTVVDNKNLEIKANVKEFGVKDIKVGQNVYITGDAFEGVTYTGTVKYIAPIAFQAQSMQGSETYIEVIIDVNETDTLLKNGLNVTCDIVSNKKDDVLTIPLGSFTEDNDNNKFVYIVENGAIKKTQVEVGLNSEDELEIVSGVTEGMEITKETKSTYEDGMKVTVKEASKK